MKKLLFSIVFVAIMMAVIPAFAAPDIQTIIEKAPVSLQAGKIDEAIGLLMKVDSLSKWTISEKKKFALALQQMHDDLSRRGEFAWLIKLDQHARKLFPQEQSTAANLGEAYLSQGKFEDAATVLTQALSQQNSYFPRSESEVAHVKLLLTYASLALDKLDVAKQAINQAIQITPNDARLYYARAQVMMRSNDWDEVNKALETAFRLDPKLARPGDYLVQASCYQRQGDFHQAEKVVREGLNRYPTAAGLHCALGRVYQAQDDPVRAFYEFQYEIMLSGPDSSYTKEARNQIEVTTALVDKNKHPETYLKIGYGAAALLNMEPNKYEKAIEIIDKGLDANGAYCLPLQMLKAQAYAALGKTQKAIDTYKIVLRLDPYFVPAYVDLGEQYLKLDKKDDAVKQFTKAMSLDKQNWRVREVLDKLNDLE